MSAYCTIDESSAKPVEMYFKIRIIPKLLIDFPECEPFDITFLTYSCIIDNIPYIGTINGINAISEFIVKISPVVLCITDIKK